MKRFILVLLVCLLLCGCTSSPDGEGNPAATGETATKPTEYSWVDTVGKPWDKEGVLLEIPLTIPNGLHYTSATEFAGDLLLWSVDDHIMDNYELELCLVSLHDGSVLAEKEYAFSSYVSPQILGDSIYLADNLEGSILELDKKLDIAQRWSAEPIEASWYIGNNRLYMYDWSGNVTVRDLSSGEVSPLLEGEPYIETFRVSGTMASASYYRNDTGELAMAVLDMVTGEIHHPHFSGIFDTAQWLDDVWLCGFYQDVDDYFYEYYLSVDGAQPEWIIPQGGTLELLDGEHLLCINESIMLHLYDLDGNALAQCCLSDHGYTLSCSCLIWSEEYQGYFCPVDGYEAGLRLLFWDVSLGDSGEDLQYRAVPLPSEEEQMLMDRAQQISEKYGVNILVSDECETEFYDFTASLAEDHDQIMVALDVLDNALSVYPEGFFHQLRYDSVQCIEIHLIQDLMPVDTEQYGASYVAFTQNDWDTYLMVVDINCASEATYYHEFSHIIDSYLAFEAMGRENALFSEEAWAAMNPSWFAGYTNDYSWEWEPEDDTSFVDSYSTISSTEDRARVLEYAMMDYGEYTFEDADILMNKLDYYCRCIRDAFDTTHWPDQVIWEQYLSFG